MLPSHSEDIFGLNYILYLLYVPQKKLLLLGKPSSSVNFSPYQACARFEHQCWRKQHEFHLKHRTNSLSQNEEIHMSFFSKTVTYMRQSMSVKVCFTTVRISSILFIPMKDEVTSMSIALQSLPQFVTPYWDMWSAINCSFSIMVAIDEDLASFANRIRWSEASKHFSECGTLSGRIFVRPSIRR